MKKPIIITLVIVAIIAVAASFFFQPKGKITFKLAPSDMTVSIDGAAQTIYHNQTLTLKPQTYTFEFSREGFSTETKSITIDKSETLSYVMALEPKTDAARKIINDNPESVKIAAAYQLQQESELAGLMPIQGVNFSIQACRSAKDPSSDKKAFCITTHDSTSDRLGRLELRKLGYNPDRLEIMSGAKNLMTVISTQTYKVEIYATDTAKKPKLYITPLNVPYVPPNAPRNEQLETIRSQSLADLESQGYEHKKYIIIFSNMYLTRYNPDTVHTDGGSDTDQDDH